MKLDTEKPKKIRHTYTNLTRFMNLEIWKKKVAIFITNILLISTTNPEFWIYQFISPFFFVNFSNEVKVFKKGPICNLKKQNKKIVKKIGRFVIQDWLLTCGEQDKSHLPVWIFSSNLFHIMVGGGLPVTEQLILTRSPRGTLRTSIFKFTFGGSVKANHQV